MIEEQNYFLELLRDHLHGRKSIHKEEIDWNIIEQYAKVHSLEPIIYMQSKSERLKKKYNFQLYYYANLKRELERLDDAIRPIDYFVFKGMPVAELYPISALRTMSDVDILVHATDQVAVHKKIVALGYHNTIKENEQVWHYSKKCFEIELHSQMIFANKFQEKVLEKFGESCWQYYDKYKIDWNFHFLFILIHLRKHFIRNGIGFRQFMDVAVICQKINIDWEWIRIKSKELEIYEFMLMTLAFVKKWFDVEIPIELPEISDDFYEKTTSWVFSNGVFGFENEDNLTSRNIAEIRRHGRVGWVFLSIFLPYKQLVKSKDFKFLVGRKYLLIFAWMKRIFLIAKNGNNYGKRYKQIENDSVKKNLFFNEWGI